MLLSFPLHIHFVGQFLSQLNFVAQMPNIQKEAVDSSFKIRKSSKTCFDAKKVVRPLGQILTFFVLTKIFFFKASTSLQEKLNFLASAHNFLTFSKNWCLAISFNIVQNAYFYVKKVVRPLGQILTFFVWTKTFFFTASTSLQENLNFLASTHNFLTFLKNCCLLTSINFSKMWENCVLKQENWAFLVS